MLIPNDDFDSARIFIEGYIYAYSEMVNQPIQKLISEWLQKRLNKTFSVPWSQYTLKMAGGDEGRAKEILIDLFEEYRAENGWISQENSAI